MSVTPTFAELTEQDQAQLCQFVHKVEWEGEEYARSDYPCRFVDHPVLTGLTDDVASDYALTQLDAVRALPDERFVDLANAAV